MKFFSKVVGGGIGWALGGPLGALLGYVLGSMAGDMFSKNESVETFNVRTTATDFKLSLMVLLAAVMKADGSHKKAELDLIRTQFLRLFGEEETQELLIVLREILKKEDLETQAIAEQIGAQMGTSSKLQILHLLFGLALADNELHPKEEEVLEKIAFWLRLNQAEYNSIKAMFSSNTNPIWAYEVLEIDKTTTDEEVKKAYRKMAMKYHPDKVRHLGEEIQNSANDKLAKLNEAYDWVKKSRGMN